MFLFLFPDSVSELYALQSLHSIIQHVNLAGSQWTAESSPFNTLGRVSQDGTVTDPKLGSHRRHFQSGARQIELSLIRPWRRRRPVGPRPRSRQRSSLQWLKYDHCYFDVTPKSRHSDSNAALMLPAAAVSASAQLADYGAGMSLENVTKAAGLPCNLEAAAKWQR